MAESDQIASITPKHDAIMTFLVANPDMKRGDIARHFGVSPSWLSVIVNSDIFQAKLKERQDEFFSTSLAPIREKLDTLAHLAIDTMIERVEVENNTSEVREMAKMALDRLGFSPGVGTPQSPGPAGIQNNFYLGVSPELLTEARMTILNRGRETIDGECEAAQANLPAPEKL